MSSAGDNEAEDNFKHLSEKQLTELARVSSHRRVEVSSARSGEYTVMVESLENRMRWVHSGVDPRREGQRFASRVECRGDKAVLLVGFGFGYHVESLLEKLDSDQQLVVVVTSPDVFTVGLRTRNLVDILSDPRVTLIFENDFNELRERLASVMEELGEDRTNLCIHPASLRGMSPRFKELKDVFDNIRLQRENSKMKSAEIAANVEANLLRLASTTPVAAFRGLFAGMPAVVVAAGPSLDRNIHWLQKLQNYAVLIVVDVALPSLLRQGIEPDFVVSVDPREYVWEGVFKQMGSHRFPLVHTLGVSATLTANYRGDRVVAYAEGDRDMDQLARRVNPGFLASGGTVALPAVDFAVQLEADPIIFAGLDFAFDVGGDRTHATGTMHEHKQVTTNFLREVEDVHGGIAYTNTSFYLYLRNMEKLIRDRAGPSFIDATEGGARIRGTRVAALQDVVNDVGERELNKNKRIENTLQSVQLPPFPGTETSSG